MIHTLRRSLGATGRVDCGTWASIRDFFDPTITNSQYLADGYECAQYGSIPQVADVAPPGPAAPQTGYQMTTPGAWTPEQSAAQGSADYTARLRTNIKAAQDAGTYNPEGNLPATVTWLDTYKWELITAASALALLVLWKARP